MLVKVWSALLLVIVVVILIKMMYEALLPLAFPLALFVVALVIYRVFFSRRKFW